MSSSSICMNCLRTLRHGIRTESRITGQRYLSNSLKRCEQQPKSAKSPSKKGPLPAVIPTKAATVTTNIAAPDAQTAEFREAARLSRGGKRDAAPEFTTSQMQKQILQGMKKDDLITRAAKGLRKTAKSTTDSYITYGETEAIFKVCASQADYTIPEDQRTSILTGKGPPKTADGVDLGQSVGKSWWFDSIGLQPTFATWSQVTFLHMYIITVRLRTLDTETMFRDYQRYLIEHFSHAAEDRMAILHNMSARGVRNKYLKDLFLQWRGALASYDEGLIKGDAVLGAAVWRNLFQANENVDWERVAAVVAFIRRGVQNFGTQQMHTIIHNADGPNGLWAQSQA